ncbi:MAG: hypothetical protein QMC85_06555, partial [Methanocellales archaeon]|nr:hypothetical protein [Methanocellales archaeon]
SWLAVIEMIYTVSLGFPGVEAYFRNLEAIGLSKHITLKQNMQLTIPKDAVVLFGPYTEPYKELIPKIPNRKGVLFTSSSGEIGLTPNMIETVFLERTLALLDDGGIDFVLFSDPKMAEIFKRNGVLHCPCPIAPNLVKYDRNVEKTDGISLFCPAKLSKSIYGNLLAVKLIQEKRDIKLHTNLKGYENLIKMLGIDAEIHDWLPTEHYHKLLSSMGVNLAVEWCGSYFNYNVVEAALLGVPSVVNAVADFYPLDEIAVRNPDDPTEIADKVNYALDHPELGNIARGRILKLAEKHNAKVREVLDEI